MRIICGDFNSCGNRQLFVFAKKYGYNIIGSLDKFQSKSHMYCLFKNIKGIYNMFLSNYKIINPVHDKLGNHPVIECEFAFQRNCIIDINGVQFSIETMWENFKGKIEKITI